MREIKFKIWDKKNKRWFHGSTDRHSQDIGTNAINLFGEVIAFGEILRDQNNDETISLERMNDLVPVQYTGLKDKNGVEIYEGDVYSVWIDKANPEVVEWRRGGFRLPNEEYIEVIGNIYESPELLKGDKGNA